jgi:hypothetical protein
MNNKLNLILKNFYINDFLKSLILMIFGFAFFLIIYYLKRNFFPGNIIYNEGMLVAISSSILFCIPLFVKKIKKCFLILSLTFLINYSFIATFPTLIDRSISIMILKSIKSNNKMNINEIKNSFKKNYSEYKNFYQVDKRIEEQINIKNIYIDSDSNYHLTEKSKRFIKFINTIKKIFKLNESFTF